MQKEAAAAISHTAYDAADTDTPEDIQSEDEDPEDEQSPANVRPPFQISNRAHNKRTSYLKTTNGRALAGGLKGLSKLEERRALKQAKKQVLLPMCI